MVGFNTDWWLSMYARKCFDKYKEKVLFLRILLLDSPGVINPCFLIWGCPYITFGGNTLIINRG